MINKVILIGRLGKDPEVRTTTGGMQVANFSLATSESYKDSSGEKAERTEWHSIVVWRRLAEVAEKYLTKGSLVYIEGKLQTRSYESNGQTKYMTEVVCYKLQMLSSGSSRPAERPEPEAQQEPAAYGDQDDLPF